MTSGRADVLDVLLAWIIKRHRNSEVGSSECSQSSAIRINDTSQHDKYAKELKGGAEGKDGAQKRLDGQKSEHNGKQKAEAHCHWSCEQRRWLDLEKNGRFRGRVGKFLHALLL